jgi:hypothetical protein
MMQPVYKQEILKDYYKPSILARVAFLQYYANVEFENVET